MFDNRRASRVLAASWAIVVATTAGCGAEDQGVRVYPISGQVLYRNQPAAGARVTLYAVAPIDAKTPIPTAVAQADGTFRLTSYQPADGAPAGEYAATVVWTDPPPPGVNSESYSPVDKLGGRYATPDKSPLKVTVAEGDNVLEPFKLN